MGAYVDGKPFSVELVTAVGILIMVLAVGSLRIIRL
jgi:hypothetical protein